MDFTWSVLISPAVSLFRKIAPSKWHGRDVELLIQKYEGLYDMRDFVKEEKIKELMLGSIQTKDYQKWLSKEREIESHVNDMLKLNEEKSHGVLCSCMKLPHGDLMNALNDVTYHLENLPSAHGSISHAQHQIATALISPRIESRTHGQVEVTKYVNKKRKAETEGESSVEVHAQREKAAQWKETRCSDSKPSVEGHEKHVGVTEPETFVPTKVLHDSEAQSSHMATKTLTSQGVGSSTYGHIEKLMTVNPERKAESKGKSSVRASTEAFTSSTLSFRSMVEAYTGSRPVPGDKDELTYGISGDVRMPIETVPTASTKSLSATDQVSASNVEPVTEDEVICPTQIDTRTMDQSEIQLSSSEVESWSSGTVETLSDGNERMLPVHREEFKTAPSQNEVSSTARVVTFKSGPSNVAAAEQVTFSPFRIEDEMPLVVKAEAEISSKTETDQWRHEFGLVVSRSTERTVLKILQCISGVEAGKIGIHGIGGIGKTTVLKALISYPKTKLIFDMIILVTVSRYWSVRKIQNDILRQLSLYCKDSEADSDVAEKLFHFLNGKKFLLLLDDVWEQINLQEVGIPDPSSENVGKIVVASRTVGACLEMDASKLIEVETVSKKEAWELFYEQVGRVIELPHIQPFAQTIVDGCGGLPLLIIVTGRALTEENNVLVWEHASKQFSKSIANATIEEVIQLLKFSFDQLKDFDTKSCLLYSSLFPEDKEVNVFEFIENCIHEGVIAGSLGDARKRGQDIIDILVGASLLQVTEAGDSIKMHDLIRDLALGILSVSEDSQILLRAYSRLIETSSSASSSSSRTLKVPEGHFLLRAGAGLTEPPSLKEWEQAKFIFLMDNELCTLPERPSCSELSVLFLQRNYQLKVIPMSFFQFMTSLKVLNLSKTRINCLPKTLFELKNLQTLILRDCERLSTLPSDVGSLENLEVLDLRGTEISKLPDETGGLACLTHLEVCFYGSISYVEYVKMPPQLISSGIISRLHALKTLSIVAYPGDKRWYKDVKSVVLEVCNLTELSSLCFHFPEIKLLELFLQRCIAWNAQCLTEFRIVVGHDIKNIVSRVPDAVAFDYNKQGKCLRFINGENIPDAVLQILACCTAFYLDNHLHINSLSDFGVRSINGLKFCIISECPKIETVVDGKDLTTVIFPSLENLSIHHLWNLTHMCEGSVPNGSFARLRILSVHACPKLKFVFSSFMIHSMSNLEDLTVEDCPAIEEIISEGEIIDSGCTALPRLKKLTLHYLPGLVTIWSSAWPSLEYVSFYDCPRLKNIGLDSNLKHSIMEIKAEKSWWDDLEWEDTELQLHLQNCFTTISEDDL